MSRAPLLLASAVAALAAGPSFAADARGGESVVYDVSSSPAGPVVREPDGRGGVAGIERRRLTAWVEAAARSVTAYYGHFPGHARVVVVAAPSGRIGHGVTRDGDLPTIRVAVGPSTTEGDFADDWVLTHEMVHLAFPSLRGRSWLEEGVATYVEPIARAKAGVAPEDHVWRWLVWGLPKGLPDGKDHGLDSADSWGRTYWGGALFCFLADVEIRRATDDRRSLGDALRAILENVGGVSSKPTIDEVLAAGDRAVGRPVLRELYDRLGKAPGTVDLPQLFKLLGVAGPPDALRFDDEAPYAAIRRAIPMDARREGSARSRIVREEVTRLER